MQTLAPSPMPDHSILTTQQVAERCEAETAKSRRRQPADDRFCFELFRRAFVERDEAAWTALVAQYWHLVQHWIGASHPAVDDLTNELFFHLWRRITPDYFRTRIPSLAAMLAFLHTSATNAAINQQRQDDRERILSSIDTEAGMLVADPRIRPPEIEVIERIERAVLREQLYACCESENERLALGLAYEYGMTPKEIHAAWPDLFASAANVSHTKERVLERLRRRLVLAGWQ